MSNPNFITDADLWQRMGGRDKLAQLIDPEKTGTWDTTTSEIIRQDACNDVIAASGVQTLLDGLSVSEIRDRFPHLVTLAAERAIPKLWRAGSSGQAMPEGIREMKAESDIALGELAARRRQHGSVGFSTTPSQRVSGSINMDPLETRSTLSSWKGTPFC